MEIIKGAGSVLRPTSVHWHIGKCLSPTGLLEDVSLYGQGGCLVRPCLSAHFAETPMSIRGVILNETWLYSRLFSFFSQPFDSLNFSFANYSSQFSASLPAPHILIPPTQNHHYQNTYWDREFTFGQLPHWMVNHRK